MIPWLLEHVALPAAAVLTPHDAWRHLQAYERADREDPAARRARVFSRLQELLAHAYASVPFYRQRFKAAGLTPADVRSWEDFRRLPVVTRHELRQAYPTGLLATTHRSRRLRYSNTSGTTGRPLLLIGDTADVNRKYATKLRALRLQGSRLGQHTLRTTPNECQPCLESGDRPARGLGAGLLAQVRGGWQTPEHFVFVERELVHRLLHRRRLLDPVGDAPGDLGPATWDRYLEALAALRPARWVTYPLYAYLMARHLQRTGRRPPRVGVIDLSGGVAAPVMRAAITEVFGAPCFEGYGGCEFGRYGAECAQGHGAVHLIEDQCVAETLDPRGQSAAPGALGSQVVTSLANFAMPLIRLEQGDVAIPRGTDCGCGRTAPLLDVQGRLQTLVVGPDGELAAEARLLDGLLGAPGVELFQLRQRAEREFELRVVPEPGHGPLAHRALAARTREALGFDARVRVVRVDHIAPEGSRKYMHVTSCTYNRFRCVTPAQLAADGYSAQGMH